MSVSDGLAQVLSEVYRPKKMFAKSTIAGQGLACILFVLVNAAYVRRSATKAHQAPLMVTQLCTVLFDQRLN